jgi:Ca2+/Na+ antiporter
MFAVGYYLLMLAGISAMEVLVGMVMLAWTASFVYYLIRSTREYQKTGLNPDSQE